MMSAVLGGLLGTFVSVSSAPAQAASQAERLQGASRYQTAVKISEYGFAGGADVVHLARGDAYADALAAGALAGGPVLLVPSDGAVPPEVAAEVQRLDPSTVIALGGQAALPSGTLAALASGRDAQRLEGASRYETAIAISRHGFPDGADLVYVARGDGYADALSAGAVTGGPILLVPSDGSLPSGVAAEVNRLDPAAVVALGGPSAVPAGTLAALAGGRTQQRLEGATRYQTAAAITRHGFPSGADTVFLARGDGFADALAAGSLDQPILLVPPVGAVPAEVVAEVQRLAPTTVIALGGESAVPESVLESLASGEAPGAPRPPDPIADPDNPAPPPPGDSGGTDDSGGPIGQPGGPPPPPPSVDLPEDPVPWVSVGSAYGLAVRAVELDAASRGLPVAVAGVDEVRPVMPTMVDTSSGSGDGKMGAYVTHQQPNFPIWGWGVLPYSDLPSRVGRVYASPDGQNWRGQCTGTVIGRDQILLAAHCFFNSDQTPLSYFRFYPDQYGSQAVHGFWQATIQTAFIDRFYLEHRQAYYADYGILKLDANGAGERIGDVLGAFSVHMDGDQRTANRFTIGYPEEGMYKAENARLGSPYAQCRIDYCVPHYCWSPVGQAYSWESTGYYKSVGFGCYGNGGWSGGPVFEYINGELQIVSVVSTGANHEFYDCALSRCHWYGRNSWGPTFRYDRFVSVWNAAQ